MEVVNIEEKFSHFSDHWNPKIVAELNGQQVKLARLKGEFVMHQHADEDEMFLVLEGNLVMEYQDRPPQQIRAGELIVIPRGTLHKPVAGEEVKVMLFEPASTLNTGDMESELTRRQLDSI